MSGRGNRPLRMLGAGGLAIFFATAFTPLPNWLGAWSAGSPRLEPADAIVVLGRGGADSDGVLTNRSLRRVMHGVELYRMVLAPRLILSGTGDEVSARATLARGLGVPANAILQSDAARTTDEEARHIATLFRPDDGHRVLLVADPIDMPRARRVMERTGFTVLPAPTAATGPSAPEGRLALLRDTVTELGSLAYYRIVGRL